MNETTLIIMELWMS